MPITSLLDDGPPSPPDGDRVAAVVRYARIGELTLPAPGAGDTTGRWRALAGWGRGDLPSARLAEGHTDALAILCEAGARPHPGAAYGVWAARSGGTGANLRAGRLEGTVRFCSGANLLDRALVVAAGPDGSQVIDLDLTVPGVRPVRGTWRAAGMEASDSTDVAFDGVLVDPATMIGPPGFYTGRPGFWWGGAGVAAVWLGGAAGVLDGVLAALGNDPDPHTLAAVGTLHTTVAATDALLLRLAAAIDADPLHDHRGDVWTARAAAERTARAIVDIGPEAAGVTGLSRHDGLAARIADLQVFVRQHHGGRDLAALGGAVVEASRVREPV
ncbi:acyl-CoA dehydrogenase [Pseudonocardia endophytica]|uniref:Alkylation response protein AidB-like acyl-CoA dehydrogenase n=1 Tax=Pseudonocardia endophytica TaxID=401976 RepID=A0A4V2PHR4_PSEEN|nr:acyl-CoA dehydrogenase [Pseudonocardia endophytica]TCK21766.1 hypothetical protein EV378_5757 [Pseudonocardia endophytica]